MINNNKCILVYGLSNLDLEYMKKLDYKIIEITPENVRNDFKRYIIRTKIRYF